MSDTIKNSENGEDFFVFKGNPSADEVAAVLKALSGASNTSDTSSIKAQVGLKTCKPVSVWSDKSFSAGRVPIANVSWRFSSRFL